MTARHLGPDVDSAATRTRVRIAIAGTVQGVGFRPFVYRHATAADLAGWVGNSLQGVVIEAEGRPPALAQLIDTLRSAPPAHAVVEEVDVTPLPANGESAFVIRPSETNGVATARLLPDLATCPACLAELFDPANRRHLYPFINCVECGPRHSIVEALPYDRARTSMRGFTMCAACAAEYRDPADRRFHAEPNACPDCGPQLALWGPDGAVIAHRHGALLHAAQALRDGAVVAVKGIGGFHLMADARNEAAIRRLRERKRRPDKPFAVMFPNLASARAATRVGDAERALLTSVARPIVLLRRTVPVLAPSVAPGGNPLIGALLPYAPLHHLLMHELDFPLVATSGNRASEPIVTDEREAPRRLAGLADLFLVHDRPILRPLDDFVLRVACGRPLMLRRARGFAPAPLQVTSAPADVLGLGGHLKTALALTHAGGALVGPHIGDLQTVEARNAYDRAVTDMIRLRDARPRVVVRDLHPDYASSRVARTFAPRVIGLQHHAAHVAACLAENDAAPPALGVAWDGTGYGPDGTVWGGEFLTVTESGWRRTAHLRPFRLPGGETAAREPRRAAFGLLHAAFGENAAARTNLPPVASFSTAERAALGTMLARGLNAPWTSSAGRLFDAFAALCDLCQIASYEGQAACALEWAATDLESDRAYEFSLREGLDEEAPLVLDWQPALDQALADLAAEVPSGAISAALHNGLARAIVAVAERAGQARVVLTGGCFQNVRLTETAVSALRAAGFEPVWHRHVPPNDGGLALGQAVWGERWGQEICA